MTPTNTEFNGKFNDIPLEIEIETKISEENKQEKHLQEKISLNNAKFHNLTRENSLNEDSNDTDKYRIQWWIQRYSIEDSNRNENVRKKETKTTFARQNLS